MKKVVFILAGLLAFMFVGCGGGDSSTKSASPTVEIDGTECLKIDTDSHSLENGPPSVPNCE